MFNIVISVIRSKFVAIILGPSGMGITGLLTSTTTLITYLTNFGLGTSAVKYVAAADSTGNEERVSIVVTVLKRLVWITGILGLVLTIILSPWLSELTFGNRDYTLAFIWISVTLLFQQLSSGQLVILQGLRKLQFLARANVLGSLIGLVISIPVYYIYKLDGIVPVIILSSFITMVLTWLYARKIMIRPVKISKRETLNEGKSMLKMGLILSLSGLISIGVSYIVRIYISNTGGVAEVGLYNAGFAIITTYVGMIFSAMSTDYFPRLSTVAHDNQKTSTMVNQQAEVAILILAPILAVFLIFINWVIVVIYSQEFMAVNGMIHWAAIGMYFKAASWAIAFILLAKGASNIYFWNELFGNIYILISNIIGYKIAGLEGLGLSFLLANILYFIQVYLIAKFKYSFSFDKVFGKLGGIQLLIGLLCFVIMRTMEKPFSYSLGSVLIIISVWYSIRELDKRIDLVNVLRDKFKGWTRQN